MQFKTQYDARDRIFSDPGSPEHITYAGHYDDKGRVVLEESGRENIYDFIQSHAESCDIHVLMKRYQNGDFDALSLRSRASMVTFSTSPRPMPKLSIT